MASVEENWHTSGDSDIATEIASPTLCLQARSPRIVWADPCMNVRSERKSESCGDLRTSWFWAGGHTLSAVIAWNTIKLNTKQNSDWLTWVAHSRSSRGTWNRRWTLIYSYFHAQTQSESESCYQARTKVRVSSDVLGPKDSLRSHLLALNSNIATPVPGICRVVYWLQTEEQKCMLFVSRANKK